MERFQIKKIRDKVCESADDLVAEEVPLTLVLNEKELVTLLCSPFDLEDLSAGFLFTSGLIAAAAEIKRMTLDRQRWTMHIELERDPDDEFAFKRLYTSGCGRGTLFYRAADIMGRKKIVSDFRVKAKTVSALVKEAQSRSEIFLKTGGVHSASLAGKEGILAFREDIGRHNAIDKIAGSWLRQGKLFADTMIISSGRISSEVLLKARKCAIPVVVSRGAPTNQAVKLARDMGVTLAGFARGSSMNIYSAEERIIL